ncbi:hypothetical protein D3C73_1229140 [compost metagenome]
MQYGRIWAIFCQVIGCAIVKANTNGKDHVGMMHGHIGFVGAMHPQHAQRLTMRGRKRAQSHQRRNNRQVKRLCNLAKLFMTGRIDRTAANIYHRFFSRDQRL